MHPVIIRLKPISLWYRWKDPNFSFLTMLLMISEWTVDRLSISCVYVCFTYAYSWHRSQPYFFSLLSRHSIFYPAWGSGAYLRVFATVNQVLLATPVVIMWRCRSWSLEFLQGSCVKSPTIAVNRTCMCMAILTFCEDMDSNGLTCVSPAIWNSVAFFTHGDHMDSYISLCGCLFLNYAGDRDLKRCFTQVTQPAAW